MRAILQSVFVFKMFELGFYTQAESENGFDIWYDVEGNQVSIYQSLIAYWEFFYGQMNVVYRWKFDSSVWQLIQPRGEDGAIKDLLFDAEVAYVKMQDGNMRLMDYVEQLLEKC